MCRSTMKSSEAQPDLIIRQLTEIGSMGLIEELQLEIWGYGESGGDKPYPTRALYGFAASGGLIALAVLNNEPVGFSVAWVGRSHQSGQCYLQSQLVGVLPQWRGFGIGHALKLHQRDFALRCGLDLIRWTFDPMLSANSFLNIVKLGAVCTEYCPDYYGNLRSRFTTDLPSDRLWADWYLSAPRVVNRLSKTPREQRRISPNAPVAFNSILHDRTRGVRAVQGDIRRMEVPALLVEVPNDSQTLAVSYPSQAWEWRLAVREALREHLQLGYVVSDVIRRSEPEGPRTFLGLDRGPVATILEDLA